MRTSPHLQRRQNILHSILHEKESIAHCHTCFETPFADGRTYMQRVVSITLMKRAFAFLLYFSKAHCGWWANATGYRIRAKEREPQIALWSPCLYAGAFVENHDKVFDDCAVHRKRSTRLSFSPLRFFVFFTSCFYIRDGRAESRARGLRW